MSKVTKATSIKIAIPLIEETMLRKKQTYFRTYIAILLYQQKTPHQQYVDYRDFIHNTPLDISHRTLRQHIDQLTGFGWVNKANGRIYFRSQERLIDLLEPERHTPKAAYVSWQDIRTKNQYKNWLMGAIIAGRAKRRDKRQDEKGNWVNDSRQVTIARDTLKDKACGLSRKTQLKYEKRLKKQYNYADLGKASDTKDAYFVDGLHLFRTKINGVLHIVKQISNTYTSDVVIGRRNRKPHVPKKCVDTSGFSMKRYVHSHEKFKNVADTFYEQTSMINNLGTLWVKYAS